MAKLSSGSQAPAWEPAWLQSSALLKKRLLVGYIPLAKLELGVQVRPQAGAWEREEIVSSNSGEGVEGPEADASIHLTLTTDPWQLITAHGSLTKPFVSDDVVVPGELRLGGQGHLYLVVFGQAGEQPGPVLL